MSVIYKPGRLWECAHDHALAALDGLAEGALLVQVAGEELEVVGGGVGDLLHPGGLALVAGIAHHGVHLLN